MDNDKKRSGKKPLDANEQTVQVAFKVPASIKERLTEKTADLKRQGYDTNPSHVLRTLFTYSFEMIDDVFAETQTKRSATGTA